MARGDRRPAGRDSNRGASGTNEKETGQYMAVVCTHVPTKTDGKSNRRGLPTIFCTSWKAPVLKELQYGIRKHPRKKGGAVGSFNARGTPIIRADVMKNETKRTSNAQDVVWPRGPPPSRRRENTRVLRGWLLIFSEAFLGAF